MKIIIFGVKEDGYKYFESANKELKYQLTFCPKILTKNNVHLCEGHDAVIVTGLDDLSPENIQIISEKYNIKMIVTRSAGINNIDIDLFKKYNIKSAYGGGYSPTAVGEFAVSLVLSLKTQIVSSSFEMKNKNYKNRNLHKREEIRSSTVGIVGLGKIGLTTAKLFKAIGANVIGYGNYQSEDAKKVVTFFNWNDFLSKADVVVLTTAYRPGKNDDMFDETAFSKMKNGAYFVNVARGELHNDHALYNALISNKLSAAATDVLKDEGKILFVKNGSPSQIQAKLIDLYPRFLFTSHTAYLSCDALSDMAKFSLENIKQLKNNLKFDRRLC